MATMKRKWKIRPQVDWCLLHESLRHQTFTEFCDHGYMLWYYSETEERVSRCRFTKARLEVLEWRTIT